MNISITRGGTDRLTEDVYCFSVHCGIGDNAVKCVLESMQRTSRPSRRHTFAVDGFWRRIDSRQNTIKERPNVPADVLYDAKQWIVGSIVHVNEL